MLGVAPFVEVVVNHPLLEGEMDNAGGIIVPQFR